MHATASLTDFITTHRVAAKQPNADIRSRWSTRILARRLHLQGRAGAEIYLRDYGRGISAAKVISLAVMAEAHACTSPEEVAGCVSMAAEFWAKAYTLTTGDVPTRQLVADQPPAHVLPEDHPQRSSPMPTRAPVIDGLPSHLQPGSITTMQAIDAIHDRDDYIDNDAFIGQPKVDGNRMVVLATAQVVYYQSRSTALMASPDHLLDVAFAQVAAQRGTLILDGERVFIDVSTGEHRTGSQAAQANADLGFPTALVICQFAVFKALYADGLDLTHRSERVRIEAAESLVSAVCQLLTGAQRMQITLVPTAYTTTQKRELCAKQLAEGREGEVWIRASTGYLGGKRHDGAMVRTKFLCATNVVVTGLTPTTVAGRAFGAIEVAEELPDGSYRAVGAVGTGFSQVDARDLAHRVAAGRVVITVRHQGRTENGQLWHARFVRIVSP